MRRLLGALATWPAAELADQQGRVTEGGENRAHQVDVGPVTADHHHQPSLSRRLATATHGSVAPHNAASPPGLRHVRATSAVLAPNDSRGLWPPGPKRRGDARVQDPTGRRPALVIEPDGADADPRSRDGPAGHRPSPLDLSPHPSARLMFMSGQRRLIQPPSTE